MWWICMQCCGRCFNVSATFEYFNVNTNWPGRSASASHRCRQQTILIPIGRRLLYLCIWLVSGLCTSLWLVVGLCPGVCLTGRRPVSISWFWLVDGMCAFVSDWSPTFFNLSYSLTAYVHLCWDIDVFLTVLLLNCRFFSFFARDGSNCMFSGVGGEGVWFIQVCQSKLWKCLFKYQTCENLKKNAISKKSSE